MAFNGAWKIDRIDNYGKSVEKMGNGGVQKQREVYDSRRMKISIEGDKVSVEVSEGRAVKEVATWSKGSNAGASRKSGNRRAAITE